MKPTTRYIIARSLGNLYFWGSISVPYLVFRGFSISGAFTLLSFYSLLVVALEFPTGVVGDLIGHKKTVILANLLGALNMLLLSLKLPLAGYYFTFSIAALATSLISGSDDAYLRSLSTDFRHDLAKVRKLGTVFAFISFTMAGFLAKINYTLPLIITAIAWIISNIILKPLPNDHIKQSGKGNIFRTAFTSLKYVKYNLPLIIVMFYGSLNEGFQLSIKTLINSATPALNIDIRYVGMIIGFGVLNRTLAYQLAHKLEFIRTKYLFYVSLLLFASISIINPGVISLILLALSNFSVSLMTLRTDLTIHDLISDPIRASVLSLKNLFVRLFSASYLFLSGFLINSNLLQLLMLITLIVYVITGLLALKLNNMHRQTIDK